MPSHEDYMRECNEKKRLFCNSLEEMAMDLLRDGLVKESNDMVDRMLDCRLMDPEKFFHYKSRP